MVNQRTLFIFSLLVAATAALRMDLVAPADDLTVPFIKQDTNDMLMAAPENTPVTQPADTGSSARRGLTEGCCQFPLCGYPCTCCHVSQEQEPTTKPASEPVGLAAPADDLTASKGNRRLLALP